MVDATGERENLSKALEDLAPFAPDDPVAALLVRRSVASKGIELAGKSVFSQPLSQPLGPALVHLAVCSGVMTLPATGAAVLFVNIGWAEEYAGAETIMGKHAWLVNNANDTSEMNAFRRGDDGLFWCGIDRGRIPTDELDVVFVARPPRESGHRAVGIYRGARWAPDDEDDPRSWVRAYTAEAWLIPPESRPAIEWPGRMAMRRWAYRGGSKGAEHPHLYAAYLEILGQREHAAEPDENPSAESMVLDGEFRPKDSSAYVAFIQENWQARTRQHEYLVRSAGEYFRDRWDAHVTTPHPIDLLMRSPLSVIFEAKTTTHGGSGLAIRAAVGQLLEYRYFLGPSEAQLSVLLDGRPDATFLAFAEDLGLLIVWPSASGFVGGPLTTEVFSAVGIELA